MKRNLPIPLIFYTAFGLLVVLAAASFFFNTTDLPFDEHRWQEANGRARGRMLSDLFSQTGFIGSDRTTVESVLGPADLDERLIWYDLGPYDPQAQIDPRGDIGPSNRLFAVFRFKRDNSLAEVVYNHRRPILGSQEFNRELWNGADKSRRAAMMIKALGIISVNVGPGARAQVTGLLGEPDGSRDRSYYDVGSAGEIFGRQNSLVLEYSNRDTVTAAGLER